MMRRDVCFNKITQNDRANKWKMCQQGGGCRIKESQQDLGKKFHSIQKTLTAKQRKLDRPTCAQLYSCAVKQNIFSLKKKKKENTPKTMTSWTEDCTQWTGVILVSTVKDLRRYSTSFTFLSGLYSTTTPSTWSVCKEVYTSEKSPTQSGTTCFTGHQPHMPHFPSTFIQHC